LGIATVERSPDELLSKRQLAAALSVSTRTIDRWTAEGIGPPFVRLPTGRCRWRWGDVHAWLDEQDRPGE
jgi:predicted DNA-binding transcriptional regulator AlpA